MAGIVRVLGRSCLLRQAFPIINRRSATKIAYNEMKEYWAKNQKLARPLSPTLTIYGYHLTMVMSITNRVTAVALQAILVGGSCVMLVAKTDFTSLMKRVKGWELNPAVIYGAKYMLAFPFAFHTLASVRHLIWDAGVGYHGPTVLKGGYAIVLGSAILSSLLVFGVKPSAL